MNKFLAEFLMILLQLKTESPTDNLVLAGSNALMAHGLKIGWEPQDLDVVIFRPTEKQKTTIFAFFTECMEYNENSKVIPRSYLLERNSLKLNLILAYEDRVPNNLLWYKFGATCFMINSIENIVAAKLSYAHGHNEKYIRVKDMQHLSTLKNLNFNV